MAKLYYRYGYGKSADICQTAYNFNETGKDIVVMNADKNKKIISKVKSDGKYLLTRDINYLINKESIFQNIYNMKRDNLYCVLVDNSEYLTKKQAEDLYYVSKVLDITVICYGKRLMNNGKRSPGAIRLMELADIIEPVDKDDTLTTEAKLQFYYGAMNCSKTAKLLYMAERLKEQGLRVCIIKPKLDRDEEYVLSRIGLKKKADIILDIDTPVYSEAEYMVRNRINYILVDEAQFLTEKQIDELKKITIRYNIPVRCYGIKVDFLTHSFTGSGRLLEVADEIRKLKTVCVCGKGADFNARVDSKGNYQTKGSQLCIDSGNYISLCADCNLKYVLKIDKNNPEKLMKRR